VYYLYYAETMQARAMALMAQKLDASLALEGQFSADGLAAMSAESGSLTMELANSLVENIDFGDAERVWEKCRLEQPEQPGPPAPLSEVAVAVASREMESPLIAEPVFTGSYVQALLFAP
jgi:hypothetical protein